MFPDFMFPWNEFLAILVIFWSDRKTKGTSGHFFWPKNPYQPSKVSEKKSWRLPFFQDTPQESAALLFQYALAHIYRGPNVLLVLLLVLLLLLVICKRKVNS